MNMKKNLDLDRAVEWVVREGKAAPALLRRQFRLDPADARRLMDTLEWLGVVGRVGSRRVVLLSPKDWTRVLAG